jgi:hypothetical protein
VMVTGITPRRACDRCGEYLPHACSVASATVTRERFTGRRIITVTDYAGPDPGGPSAPLSAPRSWHREEATT